jgi:predicted aspartyl protease
MMILTRALPLLLLLGATDTVERRQDPEIPANPAEDAQVQGTQMEFTEVDSRLTVPVALGQRGPYPFIIDTGAERTVVSRELAGSLGLVAGSPVNVTSMTGRSRVNTVIIPELTIESIAQPHRIMAPALEHRNLGAAGLLGIDTLQDHRVAIDFETGIMTVHPAIRRRSSRPTSPDEIVITARSKFGQLIVTDAYINETRIQVVLDTGSQVSMGNNALRRRVGKKTANESQQIRLTSVTGGQTNADYTMVPDVRVGDVKFDWLPVAFADVAPFKRFGLERRPALLLGMDALKSFRHVEIDFPNRQVRFRMPKGIKRLPRIS